MAPVGSQDIFTFDGQMEMLHQNEKNLVPLILYANLLCVCKISFIEGPLFDRWFNDRNDDRNNDRSLLNE